MPHPALKLVLVAGARPNFVKIAPLVRVLSAYNAACQDGEARLDWRLVHTGQHYDPRMSEIFFQDLNIPPPHVNLEVGSGSHALQTAGIMSKFEPECVAYAPDWVVVVGDVNSTMACTLVSVKLGIKVAHVEAGLRSFDRTMPEEINRIVTDALADLLLTPSADADENLRREGVAATRIHRVGNIMIDALVANLEKARASAILDLLGIRKKSFVYVTLHRPANVDAEQSLRAILGQLNRFAKQLPVVFPIHPRTRKMMDQHGLGNQVHPAVNILEPIGYLDSLCLTENARVVLTDSGGLQEESTFFRTPCLTLRPNTERPVTLTLGSNRLTTLPTLTVDFDALLNGPPVLGQTPPLWDGKTAQRILEALVTRN
jgi:UDP-N-acetylglucosamine 2-epimerase (non-hydrolysing)